MGTLLSYTSMIVGYVIQIGYTPIMIRIIGQSQYGLYNLTNSIVSYLSLFSLGFGPAYIRFYMRHRMQNDETAIKRMNGMFMSVFLLLGMIATLAGIILVSKSDFVLGSKFSKSELALAKKLMILMVANIAISFPLIPVVSYIQANERFIFQNSLTIVRQIMNPFLALPLLYAGYGSLGMILATTVISMIVGLFQIYYAITKLRFRLLWSKHDFVELKEVAIFSSFLFLNAITDQINWNVDKFIIGRYYGAVPVAIYGIAAQLNNYYLSFSTAISNVYIPRINRIVAESKVDMNHHLTDLFIKIGRVQFMVILFILLEIIFIGRPFIGFWAGKDYYNAYPILLVLIIPVTVPLIQNAGIAIQQAKNMHIFRSVLYIAIALLNALLSVVLVQKYGALGTAFATALAIVIGNIILMNWYYQKHIGLDIVKFWSSIATFIPLIIITVIFGWVTISLIDSYTIIGFIIDATLIAIVYSISLWFTVFTTEERYLFMRKLNKGRK
ncbi:oligosaccharide flippase family protein [Lapidilactobacillus mulanensis]|uniref:Oligosaccharide flippase family protein n=1 Tax=Lapidilactobacillus mulanensis TaxID=2485999 RepID=A0ABW4DQI8_9LACO